ncbi:MAG: hypothetical protein JWQ27_1770 [Ferruginibacter sp.]|nr:hypothetical protein [Ferruginibacter sp.]
MALIKLPHFGAIDTDALDEYYDAVIEFNGHELQLDLNFETKAIDASRLETMKRFIENIRIYDGNNKGYIQKDYADDDGDTVKPYLQHHLDELAEDDLEDLLLPGSKLETHEKQLLTKLHLIRVGLYPQSEDMFASFDYSLGAELTNYVIVIDTDENGNLNYMTMES